MPVNRLKILLLILSLGLGGHTRAAADVALSPALSQCGPVAVVRADEWFAGDRRREGANQLRLLLTLEQMRHQHGAVAVVGITDRFGQLHGGVDPVLRIAALSGVPVVELAPHTTPAGENDLFLRATGISEQEVVQVVADCLVRHGPPPLARAPDAPTPTEIALIRTHLRHFQDAITHAASAKLALR